MHLPTRAPRSLLFARCLSLCCLPLLQAQELLPLEREAFALRAAGDGAGAAAALLRLAAATAGADDRTGPDAIAAARVEAWAAVAPVFAGSAAGHLLDEIDALQDSPLARAEPLLADRLGVIALAVAGSHPDRAVDARADALGFVREFWLVGPFANERGSGFATVLPPEQALDLDAELTGKRRGVRWRQLPKLAQQPILLLDRIVHPFEQSLVYAAATAVADARTDAVLELGCTGSFAVFVNGREVARRDVERPFAYDQDAVPVALRPGPNLLLFKLCHQEGRDFAFAVRVRGQQGQRLPGVRTTADRPAMPPDGALPAEPAPSGTVPVGGRSTWTIGTAGGADALRLAWLFRTRDADGDRDRRDHAAAAAAVLALPDVAEAHLLLASTTVRHGRSDADRDHNERRRALERALECTPAHVEALVQLGNLLRASSRLWREAQALANRALQIRPDHVGALLLRVGTLHDQELQPMATYELATATTADAPNELLRAAANAVFGQQPAQALEWRQAVWAETGLEADAMACATALARLGQADAAIELLTHTVIADPYAHRARLQLVQLLLARNEPRTAIALLEAWLAIAPDDANAMVLAGRAFRLDEAADAEAGGRQLELLREALAIEPNRRDDERYAEYLAAAAPGAGTATTFHAPFELDAAELVAADAGPPADAAAENDPVHWLLRQQIVRANGNGTTSTYTHEIARILSQDGARQLSRYTLRHWRGEQRGRLLACSIFRKDGSVLRPALQGATVRLPDLRPGDVVAIAGRVDDLHPSWFGDYFGKVHSFAAPDGAPVRRSELLVLAEPGRDYRWQARNGAPEPERETLADGSLLFRWRLDDVARDVPELRRPDGRERDPLVRITTYRDWDHFASWWWNLIKNQLEVTPAMRATVATRCDGLTSLDDKIAAIYHFVTTDVRYEAWEFGVHGYKPYSTSVIHERRHGDCKDKALLLCALLGEIGVECRPVLIFADELRSQDDLTLPLVEQFNHCIAWLPAQHGRPAVFLDGTATWHPTDTLPAMDQGADVLVVDRGKAMLLTVPWTSAADNVDERHHVVELSSDGRATLRLEHRPRGNCAVDLRAMLATEPARRREIVEQGLVRRFGKLELETIEASEPSDPEAPVHLVTTAALPELGQRTTRRWQLPSTWDDRDLQSLAGDAERHTPVLLGIPASSHETVRYRVPPGWRVDELPAAVDTAASFGSFHMQWRRDGDDVVITRRLEFSSPRVPVAEHEALRRFVTAVKAADAQLVLLHAGGGR